MNRQRPTLILTAFALAAGVSILPLPAPAAEADGTTGSSQHRYLSQTMVWTQDHSYNASSLSVGTGAGAGHLSVQDGARVEVPGALFIGGKGYDSPYSVEEGHGGLVTLGPGSTLLCGTQVSHSSGAQVYVGWGSWVKGVMRIQGGELITHYILRVGVHEHSDGLLELTDGGRVTLRLGESISNTDSSFLSLATSADSRGLLRVGGQSTLEFVPGEGERTRADIGAGGHGTLLIEEGSRVSLGKDYAFIGVEGSSQGLVHVRGGASLELPGVTYMARDAGSIGELLVEGEGTRLTGQDLSVAEQGTAHVVLREGASAELTGTLAVGAREGAGQVEVASNARLTTTGSAVVGSQGALQLADGGQWVSRSPVFVTGGGTVSLRGASRWEAQEAVNFLSGSTLSFELGAPEALPEIRLAEGSVLTLPQGSRLQLVLTDDLVQSASQGVVEFPLIQGEVAAEGYTLELQDPSGLLSSSALAELADGRWGLSLTLDREALRETLRQDAARLANGLWSSAGVVQDYTAALFNRPRRNAGQQLWGMGLGSFAHMRSHGGNPGYDFNGGGYAFGADGCLHEGRTLLGASFGQLYGSNKSGDGLTRIRQNSLMGSLYARYDSHAGEPGRRMLLDAYAAYGRVHNRARSSLYSTGAERSSGRWGDDVFALGLRASWERPLTEQVSLLPFVGLRYLHGAHGSFTMASEGLSRGYSSASLQSISIPLGFTLRGCYALARGQQLLPELSLAYVWDVSRRNPHLSTSMLGEWARSAGAAPGRHAFMLSPGVTWLMGEHWSSGLYYHLECRDHTVNQSVDLSVGYRF